MSIKKTLRANYFFSSYTISSAYMISVAHIRSTSVKPERNALTD